MKKITAKQKPAKHKTVTRPLFDASGWAVVRQKYQNFRVYCSEFDARFWKCPGERVIRVRITEAKP